MVVETSGKKMKVEIDLKTATSAGRCVGKTGMYPDSHYNPLSCALRLTFHTIRDINISYIEIQEPEIPVSACRCVEPLRELEEIGATASEEDQDPRAGPNDAKA